MSIFKISPSSSSSLLLLYYYYYLSHLRFVIKFTFVTLDYAAWASKRNESRVSLDFVGTNVVQEFEKLRNDFATEAHCCCSPLTAGVLCPEVHHKDCVPQRYLRY
jgi:hypothetical protein